MLCTRIKGLFYKILVNVISLSFVVPPRKTNPSAEAAQQRKISNIQ